MERDFGAEEFQMSGFVVPRARGCRSLTHMCSEYVPAMSAGLVHIELIVDFCDIFASSPDLSKVSELAFHVLEGRCNHIIYAKVFERSVQHEASHHKPMSLCVTNSKLLLTPYLQLHGSTL